MLRVPPARLLGLAALAFLITAGCTSPPEALANNSPANLPPIAKARAEPFDAVAGREVSLVAAGSLDPDGALTHYRWDFGDGEGSEGPNDGRVAHVYAAPGAYVVTLTVTDDGKPSLSATTTLALGASLVEPLEAAVAAQREGGTGGPVPWSQGLDVRAGARTVSLDLLGFPGDLGPAMVELRLIDATGRVVWSDAREVTAEGTPFSAVVGGALINAGPWRLEASASSGAAALRGELRVAYGPGLVSP